MTRFIQYLNLRKGQNIFLLIITLLSAVGFWGARSYVLNEQKMVIRIKGQQGNYFITEKDVKNIVLRICKAERDSMNELSTDKIEKALRQHKFVRDAQVALNLNGTLIISIEQDQPVARLISPKGRNGYISANYTILPLSYSYTARVLVFTGSGTDSLFSESFLKSTKAKSIRQMIEYINQDKFWKKQIAQIDIDHKLNMTFFTLVGVQRIDFGTAEGYRAKLQKVRLFYDEVLPNVGWNKYTVVNVRYKNQIICR